MTTPLAVPLDRDVLEVVGPDAVSYLQGQLSQDVEALDQGASAFSLLLEPDGKLGYWLRISRAGDDRFVLDIDGGWGPALEDRLERFKLRVRADIERLDWSCVRLLGLPIPELTGMVASFDWPGSPAVDLLGASVEVPAGFDELEPVDYEPLRITAGIPRMGLEITEGRIPAETGVVETSVSFTKGCYTGQELVSRIDSRGGNVPRRLRGLSLDGAPPAVGAEVVIDDEAVGVVTSAAPFSDAPPRAVALAYVRRSVEPPALASVDGRRASIEALPLSTAPTRPG